MARTKPTYRQTTGEPTQPGTNPRTPRHDLNVLSLPDEVLCLILKYVKDHGAVLRLVCKQLKAAVTRYLSCLLVPPATLNQQASTGQQRRARNKDILQLPTAFPAVKHLVFNSVKRSGPVNQFLSKLAPGWQMRSITLRSEEPWERQVVTLQQVLPTIVTKFSSLTGLEIALSSSTKSLALLGQLVHLVKLVCTFGGSRASVFEKWPTSLTRLQVIVLDFVNEHHQLRANSTFFQTPCLRSLSLWSIKCSQPADLLVLSRMTTLRTLVASIDLDFSHEEALQAIAQLSSLEDLSLDLWAFNSLEEEDMRPRPGLAWLSLAQLPNLKALDIGLSNLTWEAERAAVVCLGRLTSLVLRTDGSSNRPVACGAVPPLPRLQCLDVRVDAYRWLNPTNLLHSLTRLTALHSLALQVPSDEVLSPEARQALQDLMQLRHLMLCSCTEDANLQGLVDRGVCVKLFYDPDYPCLPSAIERVPMFAEEEDRW